MATLVCFHAHPDDECIGTGGAMARAKAEGHRVVLVVATRGEHGEVADGFLADGEQLWQRRELEVAEAARILGVDRVEFLGYVDSGMMGTPENEAPESFWQADVEAAATRLATILAEEAADVLTVYDDHGLYGHPDHIQVHRVGVRAGELAGTPRVYEATVDRDRAMEFAAAAGVDEDGEGPEFEPDFGSPSGLITTRVDVTPWAHLKRQAMVAHASQIPADSWFLKLPEDMFATVFGNEAYIRRGAEPGLEEDDLLAGIG